MKKGQREKKKGHDGTIDDIWTTFGGRKGKYEIRKEQEDTKDKMTRAIGDEERGHKERTK